MDKQALSKFAPDERRRLRDAVQKRLAILGITEKREFNTIHEWLTEKDGIITVNNKQFTDYKKSTFEQLFKEYQQVGYDTLVEELAYTWFNRLIAIRYMEVRDVLPDYVKILGNNGQSNQPEILNDYSYLSVDKEEIESLKMNNQEEVAYRKLFLAVANKLGDVMPFLFEKLQDWTELVLPERMLEPGGIIERIVTNEGLTNSFQVGVESIGWLYQYYISEVKGIVMKLKKVTKEQLPARTQLFTPKWIVQYMVESSLGQLWLESNPSSELKNNWKYYVEPAEQTDEFQKVINKIKYTNINLEEITFLDPAVGSGHILAYAYDLFYDMYLEEGYSKREIPQLILEKNLYGMDIDDRAAQLAAFTLTMKAADSMGRSYWSNVVMPNIISIQQSNTIDRAYVEQLFKGKQLDLAQTLLDTYKNAKEYGALIKPVKLDVTEIEAAFSLKIVSNNNEQFSLFDASHSTIIDPDGQIELIKHLIKQQQLLTRMYDVVVTNPPYMGNSTMSTSLSEFAKRMYPYSKADLFAMFMERNSTFTKENGFNSAINQHSWMFLSSYENLRKKIIDESVIYSMLHLGPRAFEDIGGEVVQSTAYVQRELKITSFLSKFYRLVDSSNAVQKEIDMLKGHNIYFTNSSNFSVIPGSPIAYWASDSAQKVFSFPSLGEITEPRVGIQTSDNDRFIRRWYETNYLDIGFGKRNKIEARESQKKWFPFNKGGSYRKWFGNLEYVINWYNDGEEAKQFATEKYISYTRILKNLDYLFREGITWSKVTSSNLSLRYQPFGTIFSDAGMTIYFENDIDNDIFAILNSKVVSNIVSMLSSTINFEQGVIKRLPIIKSSNPDYVSEKVEENIIISKEEWDSYESSWNFTNHPFVKYKADGSLNNSFIKYNLSRQNMFERVKNNEELLNSVFIKLYGLQDELTPEVEDKEITIRLANRERDTISFLSYFVGCLLGRYSLDIEGLAFAGGEFDWEKYKTFVPSNDGIVTFTDEKVLPDEQDIYERLKEFLVAIYGEELLTENLAWIAEGLGKKDSVTIEATIRNYFVKDFIKGHVQTYQKRPIYWLIDSGKQKSMQSLVYLHRYTPQTMGLAMQNHFIPLLTQLRNLVQQTEAELDSGSFSSTEKSEKTKLLYTYKKRSEELADFQDSLNELARQEILLDLDNGVKVNYKELASVLYPIKF